MASPLYKSDDIWQEVRVLGAGAIGKVTLFRNETSKFELALKEFKSFLPSERQCRRWNDEVDIMNRLIPHPNVVKTLPVPPALVPLPSANYTVLPCLAMEFCKGGDLRRILSQPESCMGLDECTVRAIVTDVSSGLEHLHRYRVIHRDLKPENVVIQIDSDDRKVYKLIDLGYAKQLDPDNSLAKSFVGTMMYLAPELIEGGGHEYTKVVDFWTLGVLVCECLTGRRPFFHDDSPITWKAAVEKKRDEEIIGVNTVDAQNRCAKVFLTKLPPTTQLPECIVHEFEEWLRLVLRFNPKTRGVKEHAAKDDRPECFAFLDRILATNNLSVYVPALNQYLTYKLSENHKIGDVVELVAYNLGLRGNNVILLTGSGKRPLDGDLAVTYCADRYSPSSVRYLFAYSPIAPTTREELVCVPFDRRNPKTFSYEDRKQFISRAICFAERVYSDFSRLLESQVAFLSFLDRLAPPITQSRKRLTRAITKLTAVLRFFRISSRLDLDQNCTASQRAQWLADLEFCDKIEDQVKVGYCATEARSKSVLSRHAGVVKLKLLRPHEFLSSVVKDKKSLCDLHRGHVQLGLEERRVPRDCGDVSVVVEHLESSAKVLRVGAVTSINQSVSVHGDLEGSLEPLISAIAACNSAVEELSRRQEARQRSVWEERGSQPPAPAHDGLERVVRSRSEHLANVLSDNEQSTNRLVSSVLLLTCMNKQSDNPDSSMDISHTDTDSSIS